MSIEWDKLRAFDGSVQNAFEELCAQVARMESQERGWAFTRNGKPDAGLECFATQPSGSLVGWQAKWFTASPTNSQWADLEGSFRSALENYPEMRVFVVCLPLDRGNARDKRLMAMEKWKSATAKWAALAKRRGRKVAFEYRGTSELFAALSRRDQAGRLRFWFNTESFEPAWFRGRFEESWANNRRRYRPELDVAPPASMWEGAICQTKAYVDQVKASARKVAGLVRALDRWAKDVSFRGPVTEFAKLGDALEQTLITMPTSGEALLPLPALKDLWHAVADQVQRPVKLAPTKDSSRMKGSGPMKEWESALYRIEDALRELGEFVHGEELWVNQARAVLLMGDAGQGKTHTLFRLVDQRTRLGLPAVVLCGVQFAAGDPWAQIIQTLGLSIGRDEFLGALNAAGEAADTRALLVIDALNESDDPSVWKSSIAGILKAARRYPFLALAFSMRGEFAEALLPEGLSEEELPRLRHMGFAGQEAVAAVSVFKHFGVRAPEVPLLDPEFANPLFVVTLAEGLERAHMDTLPPAAHSLRWVFDLWLDGVNAKVAQARELDFDASERRVQKACAALARAMADRGSKWIPAADAKAVVEQVHASASWTGSLFKALLSEDVIERFQVYDYPAKSVSDRVRFTFDRFTDHHLVRAVLARHPGPPELEKSFRPVEPPEGESEEAEKGLRLDAGLLRAMAIELPEDPRFRCELGDVLKGDDVEASVRRAVMESIVWRAAESVGPALVELVRSDWKAQRGGTMPAQVAFIERLLQLSTRPGHPLNAEFLDGVLRKEVMSERDYWWSRPLTAMGSSDGVVMRLIDWFHSTGGKGADKETIRLAATTLFWFFSTSNRFVRDRATKAAVSALSPHPDVAGRLTASFLSVDDPYILERVLAVCYGVALRTSDAAGLAELAGGVFSACFDEGRLPVHLVARSYAQSVVDAAVRRGVAPAEWKDRARPPYRSDWPSRISAKEDWAYLDKESWDIERGLKSIRHSVFDDDFSHYIISSGSNDWLRYRLNQDLPVRLTRPESLRNTTAQWALVEAERGRAKAEGKPEFMAPVYAGAEGDVPPWTTADGRPLTPSEIEGRAWIPHGQMQCMVMDEVVRLGYSSRLDEGVRSFGRDGDEAGRMGTKSERMGKKYQWIALWTSKARIADRFRYAGDHTIRADARYEGSWQISRARDIDPTCLLRKTASGSTWGDAPTWWAPFDRTEFERPCNDRTWVCDVGRVPKLSDVCGIVQPDTGRRWVVGAAHVRLNREEPKGIKPAGWRRRSIWYHIETVLVREKDAQTLVRWLNKERRASRFEDHRLLPDRPHLGECFLREFPNSQAWDAENIPYHCRDGWHVSDYGAPVGCAIVADGYFQDGETDAGRDEVLQFMLPSAEVFDGLGLRHDDQDGHFVDADRRLVAWDPSVTNPGPMALLLDEEMMLAFARRRRLRLVTLVHGEQLVLGDGLGSNEYLGRTNFSGVFTQNAGGWAGRVDAAFAPPPTKGRAVSQRTKKPGRAGAAAAARAIAAFLERSERPKKVIAPKGRRGPVARAKRRS